MTDSISRHPDLLTGPEAAAYLRLTDAAGSPEAALRVLERLRGQGKIQPLAWCKSFLYHRNDLDRFVQRELDALSGVTTNAGEHGPTDEDFQAVDGANHAAIGSRNRM